MEILILSVLLVFFLLIGVKNNLTYRYHMLFIDAIGRYQIEKLRKHEYTYDVDFDDLEGYNKTLLRLWDWGYTRILPPEKFEIIRPYVLQVQEEWKNG